MESNKYININVPMTVDQAWYIHEAMKYASEYSLNKAVECFRKGDVDNYLKALDRSRDEASMANYFRGKVARHEVNVAIGDDIKDMKHPWGNDESDLQQES